MKFGMLYTYNIWLLDLSGIQKNDDFIDHSFLNKFKN